MPDQDATRAEISQIAALLDEWEYEGPDMTIAEQAAWLYAHGVRLAAQPPGAGEPKQFPRYHEIRLDEEGALDDIVLQCDGVHLERMDTGRWWLGLYHGDKRTTFDLVRDGEAVLCTLIENDTDAPLVPASGGSTEPHTDLGVYFASRTRHAGRWLALREQGFPVSATWIDEAEPGQTHDYADLMRRCVHEASHSRALILYAERDDCAGMKGAWFEMGAAAAAGVPIFFVGVHDLPSPLRHPAVTFCDDLEEAMALALVAAPDPSAPAPCPVRLADDEHDAACLSLEGIAERFTAGTATGDELDAARVRVNASAAARQRALKSPCAGRAGAPAVPSNDDADAISNLVLQVLCRVFDDGVDEAMNEWHDWYKPEQWLWYGRALGAFIRQRLDKQRAGAPRKEEESV